MAIKRSIDTGIWNDNKVFKYFDMYDIIFWFHCLTNLKTNLCGVANISPEIISFETRINNTDKINELINRFENKYKMIKYNYQNEEMIILNWNKYNWTSSTKVKTSLLKQIKEINTPEFVEIITKKIDETIWSEKK